jgi:hypothetical protein
VHGTGGHGQRFSGFSTGKTIRIQRGYSIAIQFS